MSSGRAFSALFALSAGLVAAALATASGVTHLGGGRYHTEFANQGWWWAGVLLAVPINIAARRHPRHAARFVVAALLPQIALPFIVIWRSRNAGWGDGLESLGPLIPILMTPVFVTAAMLGRNDVLSSEADRKA